MVADALAKFGAKMENLDNYSFFVTSSPFVAWLVWADVDGTTPMRKGLQLFILGIVHLFLF